MSPHDLQAEPMTTDRASDGGIRFSVYIPVWNEARWLPGAIESVLAQTHPDWELIIGDNASDDDLAAVVAAFEDSRIRYVRWERHVPLSENHNRTMLLGRYPWLHVLSADDRMHPDALAQIAARIEAYDGQRLAMVLGACRRVDEAGQPTDLMDGQVGRQGIYEPITGGRYDAEGWVRANALPGIRPWMVGAVSVDRELVMEVGGWRPEMGLCHDLEFLVRIAAFGDVEYVETPLMDYTVRSDSVTTSLSKRHMRRGEAMVQQGVAWQAIMLAHAARRTISPEERGEVDAAIARAFLQRALWQRLMHGGRGRRGAVGDIWQAAGFSARTVIAPRNLAAATIAIIAPRAWLERIRARAHRSGRVLI